MLKLRIQDLLITAWRFQLHLMNPTRGQINYCWWWFLHYITSTIFISASEIVLNSFNNIRLNILFFFKYKLCSVNELTFFIISQVSWRRCSWCCLCYFLSKIEFDKALDDISQHKYKSKINIYYLLIDKIKD